MPELPEVETLRRVLLPHLVGRTIVGFALTKPRMLVLDAGMRDVDVIGRQVELIDRRAKLLVFRLSGDAAILVHLKLAGQLSLRSGDRVLAVGGHPVPAFDAPLPHKSTHGRIDFDDGSILWLTDIRQFARVTLTRGWRIAELLQDKKLGVEPLDPAFTVDVLTADLRRHTRLAVKAALLDQSGIVGLGNIYADEALALGRIHPLRPAGALSKDEIERLHAAIRDVLTFAIENGVADLPNGRVRDDSSFPRAHGRHGRACLSCGAEIARIKVAARSTDYCPSCQRMDDTATARSTS